MSRRTKVIAKILLCVLVVLVVASESIVYVKSGDYCVIKYKDESIRVYMGTLVADVIQNAADIPISHGCPYYVGNCIRLKIPFVEEVSYLIDHETVGEISWEAIIQLLL